MPKKNQPSKIEELKEAVKEVKTSEIKVKKFYFSDEERENFKTKDAVSDYLRGIVHQDKLLFIQVVTLPRCGLPQTTPFRIVDEDGKLALETNKEWMMIEIPANTKSLKVDLKTKDGNTVHPQVGKEETSKVSA